MCTVYGFHLLLVWSIGWLLRLNRLKMCVAANISNPLFSPCTCLRSCRWAPGRVARIFTISPCPVRDDVWTYGGDLLIGSLIVGTTLGLSGGGDLRHIRRGMRIRSPGWESTSDPYLPFSITAWEFARGTPWRLLYRIAHVGSCERRRHAR